MGESGIDARHVAGTADAPSDKADHSPPAGQGLADEGAATVPGARVLPHLAASTDLALAQLEPVPTARPLPVQGILQLVVAVIVADQGQVHLVLDELEGSVDLILAPAGDPAPQAGSVVELVGKLVLAGGQACCVNISLVQVDVGLRIKDGNVIAEPASVEFGVLEEPGHGVLDMVAGLGSIEATGIVFANTDLQQPEDDIVKQRSTKLIILYLLVRLDILELVSSCDNLVGSATVVVSAVVGDDGTASNEVIVLVEDKTGPGELAGRGLAVLQASGRVRECPGSTLLRGTAHRPLVAPVENRLQVLGGTRRDTRTTEDRVIHRRVVAASLLANWAGCLGLVGVGIGGRSVHNPETKAIVWCGLLCNGLQGFHPWVNEAAAHKVVVVVHNVTAQRISALLGEWHTAALAEAAGKLATAGHSTCGCLGPALCEGARSLSAVTGAL